jgi:membrane fusion protein (multidrug efflux system)
MSTHVEQAAARGVRGSAGNDGRTGTAGTPGSAGGKKTRRGPRVVGAVVLAVAALVGLSYGASWWIDTVTWVATDDAAIDGRQVKLSSKMMGRIRELNAAEGQKVKAGQVLVVLDDSDLRAQEAQAQAALRYAQTNLEVAKVNQDRSTEDFDRIRSLFAASATTKENLDHAQKALEAATAQYSLAQASVDTSTAQLGVIETQLLNVRIATPIDGTVEKISLYPGDLAQPGQAILSVNNLASVWVTANIEETKIGRIRPGALVQISVDAYPGRVFEGTVEMIRAGIVPAAFQIGEFTKTTQRVPVRIGFTSLQRDAVLVPGMSVVVKVRTTAELPPLVQHLQELVRRVLHR